MSIRVKQICDYIDGRVISGNPECEIVRVLSLSEAGCDERALAWVSKSNIDKLSTLSNGVYIVPIDTKVFDQDVKTLIAVDNPRLAFLKTLKQFFAPQDHLGIEPSACIASDCEVGSNVYIGHNVVIELDCRVGNGSRIGHNTVVMRGTQIGENVRIGSNCTIGSVGFGYEKDESGENILIPHIGCVIIEDLVEIGNNTAIDRAVLGATLIKKNAKIDNLVHIAHGVEIGENSLIIAHAMIAGSAKIGPNCWIAPSSAIINKVSIGTNTTVGIGAVVLKNIGSNDVVVGIPAKSIKRS